MKKNVAGVAGAARIDQLSMAELTHAELHGKRLDKTSKGRAINNDPPLTTTGLDLKKLYHAHVVGAFMPKSRAKAMQVVVQFPKDLVDGDDDALMLRHARAFVEGVFGTDAIFADRVDRDEKSRHVVDVFIAPKYIKKTKHQEKVAVSVSRHQKELAQKYGCPPTPVGTGRALQDALFEYLRDEMGLKGVKRGEPKMIAGPDWKLPEQLRMEELAEQKAHTDARADQLEVREQQLDVIAEKLAAREKRLTEQLQQAEQAAAAADADRTAQAIGRGEIECAAQLAEEDRRAAAVAREHAKRIGIELGIARDDAITAARRIALDAAIASQQRRDAEAATTAATAERDRLAAARIKFDERRKLQESQIALLVRAADEDNGLSLRLADSTFSIRPNRLTEQERAVNAQPWSPSMVAIARALANALDRLRQFAKLLSLREKAVADREAKIQDRADDLVRDRAALNSRRAEHEADVERLDRERCELEAAERRAEAAVTASAERLAAANARHKEADVALMSNVGWERAMAALENIPDAIEIDANGALHLDRHIAEASPEIARVFQSKPPAWAASLAAQRISLADALKQAHDRENEAAYAAERLIDMIEKAGPVLTPPQEAVATEANQIAGRFGLRHSDIER